MFDNVQTDCNKHIENIEGEYYYAIREHFNKLMEEIDEQKSYNLLLQKQITSMKKEKNELKMQIDDMNYKLDKVEKDLGINLQAKRGKKTMK